ncbi:MAG TPA: Ldh family oxidoreductase [Ilumatobacter sp.]|nr:Ldh family oxidoreductase [Ilumatobacter sp.]
MPTITHDDLATFVADILIAADVPAGEAATVARLTVASDLAGHDSHGVAMIPGYVRHVEAGEIRPGAPFEVVRETSTTTVIDGHGGFGFVVADRAMDITIDKASRHGMAATTVRGQSHVGRLAAYPVKAARHGHIAIAMASGRGGKWVVPFGGCQARMGTNPISVAVPSALPGVFAFDMATSAVAGGAVRVAQRAGETIPTGWIVDADGRPTTDPDDLDRGGALLPFGGTQAHKGYALSATIEALANLLAGLGVAASDAAHGNSCFMACFAVDAFGDRAQYEREVAEFAQALQATPPADGFAEVLYPGEQAHRREAENLRSGIHLRDATWDELRALAARYGVTDDTR